MLLALHQYSIPHIKKIFEPLEQFKDYVYWIRNHDMSRQYYNSPNYNDIWERDVDILFELPILWLDYLAKDDNHTFMRKFQDRHEQYYLDPEKNLVAYQVVTPNNELRYLFDRCFRCQNTIGDHYLIGISRHVTIEHWEREQHDPTKSLDTEHSEEIQLFLQILKKEFGVTPLNEKQSKLFLLNKQNENLEYLEHFNLSNRELECLYYFCQGKTYKETGKALSISPRTVETHLENILNKTSCSNKIELIAQFSRYFVDKI